MYKSVRQHGRPLCPASIGFYTFWIPAFAGMTNWEVGDKNGLLRAGFLPPPPLVKAKGRLYGGMTNWRPRVIPRFHKILRCPGDRSARRCMKGTS